MKRVLFVLSLLLILSIACDLTVTVASPTGVTPTPTNIVFPATVAPTQMLASPTAMPATLPPNPTATASQPAIDGVQVAVDPLSIILSPGLASGARGIQAPRVEGGDAPYWVLTPGHVELKLEGYPLQGKSREPKIYVFPAQAYAEMLPAAFESIHRLNNIFGKAGNQISNDQLPPVPFFNEAQVFASNIQPISFQSGRGVRFLTEYAQHAASVNNHDLFYQFQGLTSDGTYYIVAILPITAPVLAETSDAAAVLPPGGIAYPGMNNPNADFQGYYIAVAGLLNTNPPEAFGPSISQLDALIQSMQITR